MNQIEQQIHHLSTELLKHSVYTSYSNQLLSFSHQTNNFTFYLVTEEALPSNLQGQALLPLDQLVTVPRKLISVILSKLKLNTVIFARNCEIKKVPKPLAEKFLNDYHLMNATSSASNYGVLYKEQLIALASFSNGRKLDRLPRHERSFELIRFCTKTGYTVAGGLTKLLQHFIRERKAGDIMTYVDKQLSDGSSFIKAGFKMHSETGPSWFLVNRNTYERTPLKEKTAAFDPTQYYLGQTAGNIKLVFTPEQA